MQNRKAMQKTWCPASPCAFAVQMQDLYWERPASFSLTTFCCKKKLIKSKFVHIICSNLLKRRYKWSQKSVAGINQQPRRHLLTGHFTPQIRLRNRMFLRFTVDREAYNLFKKKYTSMQTCQSSKFCTSPRAGTCTWPCTCPPNLYRFTLELKKLYQKSASSLENFFHSMLKRQTCRHRVHKGCHPS